MARNKNLRESTANQLLDAISMGHIQSPLPSQSSLAELFGVSRTTIRHVVNDLCDKGILQLSDGECVVHRQPDEADTFEQPASTDELQTLEFELFFNQCVKNRDIMPGNEFTELEMSKRSNCSTRVVREFLIKFSRFNLIENISRGKWRMVRFEHGYAANLIELREMLESHALNKFMNLPKDDARWKEAKILLQSHRELREEVVNEYQAFSDLDRSFHYLILSAANNPFMEQFYEIMSVIFHYHYQWDNSDLRKRNMVAIEEHMAVLSKMLIGDDIGAIGALSHHLQTARRNMEHSLITDKTEPA
ncbi:GntR family transcriptional regulator [Vibrio sp. MACH09]|uniref:GntR family transcriptional regulator n=1 Tax=unclassified Vibrio TaxID=2614977 RepID=UPI0014933340|nr:MULTISPECIES: GntR family transcriptional regulator [unclassified Vibrio]NOI65305.1 GntR family transcriptional regulator [Vibrio sp. 99-8-1]GLO60704.1 GntR family transcriptional regulator [Vibrio sp. MACH09]